MVDLNGTETGDDRFTTFTYDAMAEYLLSSTTQDGRTTEYTYETAGNAVTLHALLTTAYPDGKHAFFEYDPQGRLAQTHADDNALAVSYTYGPERGGAGYQLCRRHDPYEAGVTGQWTQVADGATGAMLRMAFDESGLPARFAGPREGA